MFPAAQNAQIDPITMKEESVKVEGGLNPILIPDEISLGANAQSGFGIFDAGHPEKLFVIFFFGRSLTNFWHD